MVVRTSPVSGGSGCVCVRLLTVVVGRGAKQMGLLWYGGAWLSSGLKREKSAGTACEW